ncbi:MAG: lipid-A-disaccharide synthase [Bacteroidetes bacterium]|nr:MAG: lipid-A-disaccharide synthase [Bacteroidota bacterium]
MRYYIIAGEASGDLHGSNLIKELKKQDPNAVIRGWGGDLMIAAGADIVKHYKDLAFMGFLEVLLNLKTILRNLKFCKEDILLFKPDAIILVDYPGFNIKIAEWAKNENIKVIYYISPQVWAWKEKRVHIIKKCVNKMLVILPFEKEFYKKWNYEVEYVGHPLVEVVEDFKARNPFNSTQNSTPIVALLPGSRKQEILMKLPLMLAVSKYFPDYKFVVAKAPSLEDNFYAEIMKGYSNVEAVSGRTYDVLIRAKAALVTSGTATLETALFGVPEVVCYKGNRISYEIAKRIIKIKYISLVNLIMDKPVVRELIQNALTVENCRKALNLILNDQEHITRIKSDYFELRNILSQGGHASSNAAHAISRFLQSAQS